MRKITAIDGPETDRDSYTQIRRQRDRLGGQHSAPATDRLSDDMEERIALAAFEAERMRDLMLSDVPF